MKTKQTKKPVKKPILLFFLSDIFRFPWMTFSFNGSYLCFEEK